MTLRNTCSRCRSLSSAGLVHDRPKVRRFYVVNGVGIVGSGDTLA